MTAPRAVAPLTHALAGRLGGADVAEIAAALPAARIERHTAALPVLHPSGAVRRLAAPVADLLAGRDGEPWWIMLSGLTDEPRVGGLAWPEAEPWAARTGEAEGGVTARLTNLFVSSPGSTVPAHFDYQHNVLLQVEGVKDVVVAAPPSGEEEIERCVLAGDRNLRSLPAPTETIRLGPGDGVYLPPFTPHWVLGHEGTAISISCAWCTRWSDDEHLARYWNARQRRLGIRPPVPDGGRAADRAKAAAVRLRSRLRRPPRP